MPLTLLAAYVLAVCALGFYTEYVRPLPDPTRAVSGLSWWLTPRERNAFMRTPVIMGELRGMDVSRDGQVIVIVSSEDAIFSSPDAGRTWIRGGLDSVAAVDPARPPSGAFNLPLGLRSVAKAQEMSFEVDPRPSEDRKRATVQGKKPKGSKGEPDAPVAETPKPEEEPSSQELQLDRKRALFDVSIVDARTFIAVGEQGLIMRTADAGTTWKVVRSSPSMTMSAISCHDALCIAVGERSAVATSTDAGETWSIMLGAAPDIDRVPHLYSIARVSSDRWIAVGERGYVMRLTGKGGHVGGQSIGGARFVDVAFDASGQNGIAVGAEVFVTRNGGAAWERSSAPSGVQLRRVVFDDDGVALAVGAYDENVYETRDLKTWTAVPVGSKTIGRSGRGTLVRGTGDDVVQMSEGVEQLAIDTRGRAFFLRGDNSLFTRSARESWTQLTFGVADFRDLAMLTPTRGLIVGAQGTVLSTADGGDTWVPVDSGVTADLQAVAAVNAEDAIAVGSPNTVLRTTDGGAQWRSTTLPNAAALRGIAFADERHVFALGSGLFESHDSGLSWTQRERAGYAGIGFANATTGVQVVMGSLRGSTDAGSTWQTLNGGRAAWLNHKGHTGYALFGLSPGERAKYGALELAESADSVLGSARSTAFADADLGLAIAASGDTLLRTGDRGAHWASIASPTRAPLIAARFASDKRVVALAQGRVIVSDDAGKSFHSVSYQRSPAPWLWLAAVCLVAAVLVYARHTINAPDVDQAPASIADAAASDRPIQWWDPDHAGLRQIALGLSRFLRNRKTEPPLTVAITGEWGTGKSSLMNLLRHDLERYGYRPVWFNAWHHQSGENLLASLLANIHAQGVPSLFTLAGLDFRVSLTGIRARRLWLQVALTLLVFAVVGFSYPILKENWFSFWSSLTAKEGGEVSGFKAASGLIGIAIGVITPLLSVARVVRSFGLQPGKLIAAVATTNPDESTRQQAGARYRFAREFEDFTRALEPRPLVVFIDDLDRCRAPNVVEVLEAINFLVSSGRCIVVIGMARHWVETCVGISFQELAEAHTDNPEASERAHFARQYLEKLINIEVRVPQLTDAAAAAILQGMQPSAPHHDARYALGTFMLRGLRWIALFAGLGAIAGLGFCIAQLFGDLDPAQKSNQALVERVVTTPPIAADEVLPMQPMSTAQPVVEAKEQASSLEQANAPAATSVYWGSGLLLAMLALGVLVALALFARRQAQTEDSPAFRSALGIMHPFILLGGSSPRSLKRFVNHVRYVAMRSRTGGDEPTASERLGQRIRSFFGRGSSYAPSFDATSPSEPLPEELLVTFAALHRCGAHWLDALFVSDRPQDLLKFLHLELSQRFVHQPSARALADQLWVAMGALNRSFTSAALLSNAEVARRYALQFLTLVANDARPASVDTDSESEPAEAAG